MMRNKIDCIVGLILIAIFVPLPAFAQATEKNKVSIGLDVRNFYTRWYEYPGNYFEGEFSLLGL